MATKRSAKGTKAPTRKRKPAPKAPRRTIIAETMTPQPETHETPVCGYWEDQLGVTKIDPITIEGTFDDGHHFFRLSGDQPRQLTIMNGRRFLWWTVARERLRQTVIMNQHEVGKSEDGAIAITVPMTCDGPPETILAPWWERALYAVARIWS